MNRWMKRGIAAALLGVVAMLALSLSAFARGPAPQSPTPAYGQSYGMRMGMSTTGASPWAGPQYSLVAVAANVLGMKQADLIVALKDKTIAQVAQEKGVATDAIVNAFLASRVEALKDAVAAGHLTQAQADQMLATMKAHVTEQLNEGWTPAGPGAGRGVAPGWRGGR